MKTESKLRKRIPLVLGGAAIIYAFGVSTLFNKMPAKPADLLRLERAQAASHYLSFFREQTADFFHAHKDDLYRPKSLDKVVDGAASLTGDASRAQDALKDEIYYLQNFSKEVKWYKKLERKNTIRNNLLLLPTLPIALAGLALEILNRKRRENNNQLNYTEVK
ncbi:MAG: hypothetical protein ABIE22_02505 [archaeon]